MLPLLWISCERQQMCVLRRWEILEQVLHLVRECKSLEDYQRIVGEGGHILNVLPGGVLTPWSLNNTASSEGVPATGEVLTGSFSDLTEGTGNSSSRLTTFG